MNTKHPKLSIKYAVICDDIRREDNGKQILIGVYSGEIGLSSFPAPLSLAVWLQCTADTTGEVSFEFRVLSDNTGEMFRGAGKIQITAANKLLSISVSPWIVQILSPGTLKMQIKQHQGRWKTIKEIAVNPIPKKN